MHYNEYYIKAGIIICCVDYGSPASKTRAWHIGVLQILLNKEYIQPSFEKRKKREVNGWQVRYS